MTGFCRDDYVNALSKQPGLAYLGQLQNNPNVKWNEVKLASEQWSYSQQGLTPAGAALLSIAVAVASGGSAAGLVSSLGYSGATAAAMTAGMSSLASSAAVSFVNNGGDIGKTLSDMGSSANIRNIALAMASAGALSELGSSYKIDGKSLNDIKVADGFVANLNKAVVNNLASATMTSALTGTSLEDNIKTGLVSAFISAGSGQAANTIGDLTANDQMAKALAHALAGCMAGGASGGKQGCESGAIGAVVGELAAQWYDPNGTKPPKDTLDFVKVVSAAAGAITGDGSAASVSTAVMTGVNAAENNFLSHTQAAQMKKEFDACKSQAGGCSDSEVKAISQKYLTESNKNIDAVNSCIAKGDTACVTKLESQAATAGEVDNAIPFGYGSVSTVFVGRQNNVNNFGSTKGSASLFGTDVQQAQEVAQFRQDNCAGVSASACDGMVKQALDDRMTRVGILAAAGALTPLAVNGLRTLTLPKAGAVTDTLASGKPSAGGKADAMLPESELASNKPSGVNATTPVKDTFGKAPNDSTLAEHLSTGGPSTKNVYGAHSDASFKTELASINGQVVGAPKEIAPGIFEYQYNTPDRIAAGKPSMPKTTYDTRYTDAQILDMSKQASSQVWSEIQKTGIVPTKPIIIPINGVPFKVYPSISNGEFSLYAHPGSK